MKYTTGAHRNSRIAGQTYARNTDGAFDMSSITEPDGRDRKLQCEMPLTFHVKILISHPRGFSKWTGLPEKN